MQSDVPALTKMQNTWSAQINPLFSQPFANGRVMRDVALQTGVNVLDHLLGRKQQGWTIIDLPSPITMYRSADLNDLTLQLTVSGPGTVSLYVF